MYQTITRNDMTRKQIPLPAPRVGIDVRPGTMNDIPFIDALMKKHSKQLAFLPTQALEGKVRLGHVLVAWASDSSCQTDGHKPVLLPNNHEVPVGYLIGNDRYKSRDEVGVIYQICVEPKFRRMLVGAHLLKARFETSAYGCTLYGCWCAQDLTSSNQFYESMGFVPLAFRAGSEKKSRVHIYWQKRIREGDTTTPLWFPSETRGGLMDAARIALPIPPGLTWRDELPRILPTELPEGGEGSREGSEELPTKVKKPKAPARSAGGFFFGPPPKSTEEKPKKIKKNNPELAAKAREFRDRYLEQFNAMPRTFSSGKYELGRAVKTGRQLESIGSVKRLASA